MTQFSVLTSEAKAIVVNFFNTQTNKSIFCEPNKQLMVSLYSLMPEADTKVIGILKQHIVSLSEFLQDSEIDILKSEYPAVVRFCYDHKDYAGVASRRDNELLFPQSLIDLCMSLSEPKHGCSVLVPYSGDGSFAYHVSDCMVDGFEPNEIPWAFSQILLHSQNTVSSIKLKSTVVDNCKQYDYIFSFPPILQGRDGRKVIDMVYNLITKQLKENGELYCVLPMSFCSATSGWFDIRKILWDFRGQYSVLVVSLPPVMMPIIGANLCLLHVKKNHEDIIALMDATSDDFSARRNVAGSREHVLKVQSIIETINSQDERYVWVGSSKQLTGEVNLQPSRYLISQNIPQPQKGEKALRLSDVIQTIPLTKQDDDTLQIISKRNMLAHVSSEELSIDSQERDAIFAKYRELEKRDCPVIGMKELSSTYLNCDINRDALEVSPRVERSILTTDCLLIGFIGGKFKVGRLHGVSQSNPVILRSEVFPVKLISNDITEDFLLRSIMSDIVEYQARMLATGTTVSRLSSHDLLSIVINVPELTTQQDALCKEDTRSSLTEADRKIIESYEEFRKDMHMKKHAIGQTLFNLNNWWDALQQARKEGNGVVADDATTGKIRKVSVASIYDSLQKAINQLQQQINTFDRGNGLAVKNFALTEFIEDYIARKGSPLFTFSYDNSTHHASESVPEVDFDEATGGFIETGKTIINEGDPIEYVEFAPEALEIVFDNIVSNACCHGFKDRTNNIIRIDLKPEGDNYVIVISNNGSAIHSQIKPEDVFIYGKTSKMGKGSDKAITHFGIGGYEVQKLMREFGGDAKFISNPDSDFPVSYELTFFNTNFEKI
ncbi:MAG: hypothetical protein MJZ70_05445 [Bacteroidales bacterium]|nr:hypothetical protein [Bacteroidales bacterium]